MSETELYDSILFKNENLHRIERGISIKFNTDEAHKRRFIYVKFYLILEMFCGCYCKMFRGGSFFVDTVYYWSEMSLVRPTQPRCWVNGPVPCPTRLIPTD